MDMIDLPVLHRAAQSEEKSTQTISGRDDNAVYTQAEYFLMKEGNENLICIAVKDITAEYIRKYHPERNRVRLRIMVKQRTEEYETLTRELLKVNGELSQQIKKSLCLVTRRTIEETLRVTEQ